MGGSYRTGTPFKYISQRNIASAILADVRNFHASLFIPFRSFSCFSLFINSGRPVHFQEPYYCQFRDCIGSYSERSQAEVIPIINLLSDLIFCILMLEIPALFIMHFNPLCLINIFLAAAALLLYAIGSYKFFRDQKNYLFYLGSALAIDILTATLASLRITPTTNLPVAAAVPWYSLLFKVHVILSMIGFVGFIALFLYLLISKPDKYKHWIRKWQFRILLPVWIIGEGIAICNSLAKMIWGTRLFEMI